MIESWKSTPTGFAFSTGKFSGSSGGKEDGPAAELRIKQPIGPISVESPKRLSWIRESARRESTAEPAADTAYVQQPYLVVPFSVATDVGLRLTAFYRATELGVDLDYRLATIATLERVWLDVTVTWSQQTFRDRTDLLKQVRLPRASAGINIVELSSDGANATVFTDVGEYGTFEYDSKQSAKLRLFNQPLEKGVILVGRITFRSFSSDEEMIAGISDWLEHPSASL